MQKINFLLIACLFFSISQVYAQFTEDFEGGIPATWTVINGGDANTWQADPPGAGTANSGVNVAEIIYSATAHDDYLVTEQFTVTAGVSDRLSLYYRHRDDFYAEPFDILLSSTGNTAADFTTTIASAVTPTTLWQQAIYPLTAYVGQTVYIAFYSSTTDQFELYLDDIVVDALPSCPDPTALIASNLSTTTADLSWTAGNTETLWNIEWGATGFTQGTGTVVSGVTNPYTLSGLTASTDYDYYVQADCGAGGVSTWVGPLAFSTTLANNDCASATSIPVAVGTCTPVIYDTSTATDSGNQPSCDQTGTNLDIWFSFVAPTAGGVELEFVAGTSGDVEYAVWSSCGGTPADEIFCDNVAADGEVIGGLTGGNTYYLQVWNDDFQPGDFSFCLLEPACVAPTFTVSIDDTNCATDMYDIIVDVTTLGTAATVDISNDINANTVAGAGLGMSTLTGFSSADGTVTVTIADPLNTTCNDTQTITIPAGCPPANDECATAVSLTVDPDLSCTSAVAGSTVNATESLSGCLGTADDDVWYSFTAVGAEHTITIVNTGGSSADIVTEVFDACGGTSLVCQDSPNSPIELTGLTPATTYYFRIYTYFSGSTSEFDVCVGTNPPPPANDECANAVLLTVDPNLSCASAVAGSTVSATESLPGCLGTADDDVWYSFVATGAEHIITINNTGGVTDIVTEVFDACGGTSLVCQDSPNSPIELTGLTPATTYYFRIFTWAPGSTSDFEVCVGTDVCPAPTALAVSNVTSNSVDLSWTAGGTETAWDIEVVDVTAGGVATGTVTHNDVSNPYTVMGLNPDNEYQFYVRADCAMDDVTVSSWEGPAAALTPCADLALTCGAGYSEDYTAGATCWRVSGGSLAGPATAATFAPWYLDEFANDGSGNQSFVFNAWDGEAGFTPPTSYSEWAVSPVFDLSGGSNFELTFDIALTDYDVAIPVPTNFGTNQEVQLLITTDGGTTWSNLLTWDATSTISEVGEPVTVDLSSYTGSIQIGFWGTNGDASDLTTDVEFHVDNVMVSCMSTCMSTITFSDAMNAPAATLHQASTLIETSGVTTITGPTHFDAPCVELNADFDTNGQEFEVTTVGCTPLTSTPSNALQSDSDKTLPMVSKRTSFKPSRVKLGSSRK